MRHTTSTMSSWATLLILLFAAVAAAQPAKLAILASDAACLPVAEVMTAEFSHAREFALVERSEINRVLSEQKLSAVVPDQIKLGRLLAADGLLVLVRETREGGEILTARLIAVNPGVTLTVEVAPWPLLKPDEWSRLLGPRLAKFAPKLTVLAKEAIPLSVLYLRSAVRTTVTQESEKELTQMLIHRLTREREVFVLERQHLHEALFERQLLVEDEREFWTGRYLLDGTIDKNGFNPAEMTLTARLASPQGGPAVTLEVSGPRTNLTALVEILTAKTLSALHKAPASDDWRPLAEADQFYQEAKWAYRWKL